MGGWSPQSATNAYFDTLKLCKDQNEKGNEPEINGSQEWAECNEAISALAAGMTAKLIVEVSSQVSPSTIALAAAARQTGGRLVCILPEEATLTESKQVIKEKGLKDMVEFRVGNPFELLPTYENIDFSLIDCKTEDYTRLLNLVDVNPKRSVVVANHLKDGEVGLGGNIRVEKDKTTSIRSTKHIIGKGVEVTMFGKSDEFESRGLGSHGGGNNGCSLPSGGGGGVQGHFGGGEVRATPRRYGVDELGGSPGRCRYGGGGGTPSQYGGGGGTPPRNTRRGGRRSGKSKWVVQYDEKSGEEHITRVPFSL